MALAAGSRLGPYEILDRLGAGGMGEVYRARDTRLGREVAVKILPSAHATDPESVRRFEKVARPVASLGIRTSCPDIARFDLARKRPRSLHDAEIGTRPRSPTRIGQSRSGPGLAPIALNGRSG